MLQELSIKNFAIIDTLALSFEEGLTVLSGETGAGKSIIIDAIHLLVGGRGSAEYVRHGEKKAEIEGLFILDDEAHPCYEKVSEFGIEIEEGMIVLRREIASSGKSVCRVNGKLVTIAIMREIGGALIDIHGQHEHQELMNEHLHLSLLDQFGGKEIQANLASYREIYKEYSTIHKQLSRLNDNEQEMAHRLDLITFQLKEIQEADLKLNEDEELLEEKRKLMNFEKLYESLQTSYNSIQGEGKGLDWTGLAMSHLETAADLDNQYQKTLESVSNAFYVLEDAVHQIRGELDQLEFEPDRLDLIETRLNEINSLKRKYGSSVDEILAYGSKIEEEIETILNKDSHIDELQKKLLSLEKDLIVEAKNLTHTRKKWAKKLTGSIHEQLKQLYMDKTKFEVRFSTVRDESFSFSQFKKDGWDQVEFYISTNPGEPLKPLSKVASGGELSRIMLALKTIFSKHQGITSIIFDEVDTGVSGRVAQAIAEKIYQVATHSQVMCISHLPQVAAMADSHLFISKRLLKGRTSTSVKRLEENEKVREISRMISGVEITDLTQEHAKELLQLANTIKET
ncbi:DNA repair protein RecN [[Bacillus] enclensis]|uniref:DNA repair protein RecN n=1 Tax=[Bacillus] enclensis TaxID=1402860 RepID=A0A0V8HMF8_9BACI|nr:DNA repair protein RecN [[Bacillus] enclensis]KSU63591.1 DNA repair protein RecN [[Bacillus] enclensis]QWC21616.1 DNA repair protein RecN [Bacillus haikouensis]SCB86510.1 DNA repair protein RecN (Recombination protein N) [[Bacillus] enclensis]